MEDIDTGSIRFTSRDKEGLFRERKWRCLDRDCGRAVHDAILVSRWVGQNSGCRQQNALSPPDRYVVGIALKTTQLTLTRGIQTIFDGVMPAGTVHMTRPAQQLSAEFRMPSDFIHFHILRDYFQEQRSEAHQSPRQPLRDTSDLFLRDALAEQLARVLLESESRNDAAFGESVASTLVMHIARLKFPEIRVSSLPKWRLRRLEKYVDENLHKSIGLVDQASSVGLSPMHFAAQFRAATGYRPHEYLLCKRIERAKSLIASGDLPLVEVALAVGFQTQSHFTTVFRRVTGQTPARWRSDHRIVRRIASAGGCIGGVDYATLRANAADDAGSCTDVGLLARAEEGASKLD
jgi:AraC family transcriptional regulator